MRRLRFVYPCGDRLKCLVCTFPPESCGYQETMDSLTMWDLEKSVCLFFLIITSTTDISYTSLDHYLHVFLPLPPSLLSLSLPFHLPLSLSSPPPPPPSISLLPVTLSRPRKPDNSCDHFVVGLLQPGSRVQQLIPSPASPQTQLTLSIHVHQ